MLSKLILIEVKRLHKVLRYFIRNLLYQGWGSDGTVWFASEMKALQSVCDHMEVFPPGHYYTATAGGTDKVGN